MQTRREGLFQEHVIQVVVRQLERHVHARTVSFGDIVTVEIALVDHAVQQFSFLLIDLVHLRHAAFLLQPFEDQAGEVPGERWWSVEHGIVVVQDGVIQN